MLSGCVIEESIMDRRGLITASMRELERIKVIAVPTITLEGDANGAPHPEPVAYAQKFVGVYKHQNVTGGIGHNLPQEAP
jgi:hypothetical protein